MLRWLLQDDAQPNADSVGHLTLTVTSKGQVTLRKELLAYLGVKPGQRLDVEVLPGGRLELHAEQATGTIAGFIGFLAGRSSHRASLLVWVLRRVDRFSASDCIGAIEALLASASVQMDRPAVRAGLA